MLLEECRKKIDAIDAELLRLLNRRAALSKQIGQIKSRAGLPVIDLHREDIILRRVVRNSAGEISPDAVERIYGEILAESRRIQIAIDAAGPTCEEVYG